ncbi:hypothetical protein RND81_11G075100 [Saponaria officinalis]|uniref:Coiled-coil domain-containing protein 47 n=1 Tax=Saponaria officinalis TaxID=3572 RepID=A0AAW1HI42_SAPOF
MAKWISPLLLSLLLLHLLHHHSLPTSASTHHFEGFGDDDLDLDSDEFDNSPPIRLSDPPTLTQSDSLPPSSLPSDSSASPSPPSISTPSKLSDYWDEDEFEGLPIEITDLPPKTPNHAAADAEVDAGDKPAVEVAEAEPQTLNSIVAKYTIEIICVSFLVIFLINYFTGKKENENLALAWAAKFATKDAIFEKNFSLLGVGEGDDSPLLLKEGQNVFKFYASGRRYCQGLLATMELKSRHDLISRVYNAMVPSKDEISLEVYMNDESMDQVVFAVARKKMAKTMFKELPDLQRFGSVMPTPTGRKWVSDELSVVSESKEVAADLITEAVLDQVLGDKVFEKLGKYFISMHFSDQQSGPHKKKLMFKFALPDIKNMADMTRLVALVPYYIDFVGRYKLSSQARSKTDAARVKVAQEVYKELQNVRQEALQRKKADRKKMMEEAEAKLSAEAIRKREAKERARQMKKGMPKMKMTRA